MNEKKTWRKFDKLSFKSKRKDKKNIKVEKIETNIEKFKTSRVIKSFESSFFSKKFKTFTSQFIFESKNTKSKKIETKFIESFLSLKIKASDAQKIKKIKTKFIESSLLLRVKYSKTQKIKKIETNTKNSLITKKKISMTITSIESISSFQIKKTRIKKSSIKSFWNKRNDRKIRTSIWKTSSLFIKRTINHKKRWKKIRLNTRIMRIVFFSNKISEKMLKNDTSIWARSWKVIEKLFEHRSKFNSKWKRTRKSTNIYCYKEWSF